MIADVLADGAYRTAQHAGEVIQPSNAAPSVAEVLDAMKIPAEVKKTN